MKLAFGRTRIVLLIGRFAIKAPRLLRFREGIQQNKREANYPSDVRVCGVLASFFGGLFIVMPRADRTATTDEWEASDYYEWCDITTDIYWHNFGWFGNEMLLIDYGKL